MSKKQLFFLALLVLSAAGGMVVAVATRIGVGVGGDATVYIAAARNLLAGSGLGWIEPDGTFRLLADFPPGYPLLLAISGLSGADMLMAARWANVLLFAAAVWLAGLLVYQVDRTGVYALLAAGLFMASPVLIPVYSWAMSEPLFLFLGLLTLFLLLQHLSNPGWRWLLLAALAAGLAFLTRYNGIAVLGAGALALLVLGKLDGKKRIVHAFVFLLVSGIPMAIWLGVSYLITGLIASRRAGTGESFAEMIGSFWRAFSESLNMWVLPDSWVYGGRFPSIVYDLLPALILAVVILSSVWFMKAAGQKMGSPENDKTLLRLLGIFAGVYSIVILATRFTVFPIVAINNRMLSPLYVMVLLIGVMVCRDFSRSWLRRGWKSWLLPAVLALGVVWYAYISFHIVNLVSRNGLGYTSLQWQQSELMAAVKDLPADAALVTNEPKAVLLLTGRTPYQMEEIYYRDPLELFSRYGDGSLEGDEAQQAFRDGAALVLFNSIRGQVERLYGERTPERLQAMTAGLKLLFQGSDGAIYLYPATP